MKKFDVYGIGNALVDIEIQVTDSFLKGNGIDKGIMTLVDEERQGELLQELKNFSLNKTSGGSAANTLICLRRLGGQGHYSCKVADDEFGHFFEEDLNATGISTNCLNPGENGITGKCLVMITPDAERTMNTYLGITQSFGLEQIKEDMLKNSKYLYIEGYLVASPTARKAVLKAKEIAKNHGVKIALSFSDPFLMNQFKKEIMEILEGGIDLVFCNEDEALAFGGCETLDESCEELKKYTKAFAITRGKEGSLIYDGQRYYDIDTESVSPIDTTGAGDSYAGAFLFGLTHQYSFEICGRVASLAAASVVSKLGARVSEDQAKQIMTRIEIES